LLKKFKLDGIAPETIAKADVMAIALIIAEYRFKSESNIATKPTLGTDSLSLVWLLYCGLRVIFWRFCGDVYHISS